MSLDPKSIARLRELGRQLPQSLPIPNSTPKAEGNKTPKLHAIETEEDPEKLFKELIKASPDGEIPPHLINRLREVEAKISGKLQKQNSTSCSRKGAYKSDSQINKRQHLENIEEEYLYSSFERLLLEQEGEEPDSQA